MYEHPIKQAGLSMNRILFSNTMMVMGGFPNAKAQIFQLSFKYRTFENGKSTSTQYYNADDLDEVMPARQVGKQ